MDLKDPENWNALTKLAKDAAKEGDVLLDFGRHFWCIPLDQSEILPAIYREKYSAARKAAPIETKLPADRFTLAVHIRRTDVKPGMYRYVDDDFYRGALSALLEVLPREAAVHVFSDGSEEELSFLREMHPGVVLRLDADQQQVFHDMVSADALLMGQSFFAVLAGKISSGLKLIDRRLDVPGARLWLPDQKNDPSWLHIGAEGLPEESRDALTSCIRTAAKAR